MQSTAQYSAYMVQSTSCILHVLSTSCLYCRLVALWLPTVPSRLDCIAWGGSTMSGADVNRSCMVSRLCCFVASLLCLNCICACIISRHFAYMHLVLCSMLRGLSTYVPCYTPGARPACLLIGCVLLHTVWQWSAYYGMSVSYFHR